MEITLTQEQSEILRHAMAVGRIHDPEQAMHEAMALWLDREQRRKAFIKTLDDAEASHARGEGRVIRTEADRQKLVADVMERCHARLAAAAQSERA